MANLSAVVTARHTRLGEDFLDGTYYVTDQAHGSNTKAAKIAGFGARNLRLVPTDDELRMDPDALATMVAADRAAGFRPFLVVAAAGTTNTGAIDPLDAIATVAEREGHVVPHRCGLRRVLPADRARPGGVPRVGACRLDHAGSAQGSVPAVRHRRLIVRDREAMRDAHFEGAAYLQDLPPSGELPNYTELTPELSRECAGCGCGSRWCCTAWPRSATRWTRSST